MGLFQYPRADDEAILRLLKLRRSKNTSQIGAMFGMTSAKVRVITDRVVRHDSDEEGRNTRAEYRFLNASEAQAVR